VRSRVRLHRELSHLLFTHPCAAIDDDSAMIPGNLDRAISSQPSLKGGPITLRGSHVDMKLIKFCSFNDARSSPSQYSPRLHNCYTVGILFAKIIYK
jgi:hypothetical protein